MTRWTSLIGALGVVTFLFGIASLLIGLFTGVAAVFGLTWVWLNLGLGLVLLVVSLVLGFDTWRERMSSGEARRVGTYGTSALVSAALSIAIVAALAFFAEQNPVRWDWTESGTHSLSDQTTKVLQGLERDVQATALYGGLDQLAVKPVLERYAHASERFQFTMADPNDRPDVVQALGIDPERLRGGLLHVAIGDDSTVIDEPTEEEITNAIVQLTRTTQRKVYFLVGHNERPIEGEGAREAEGYARAAESLANESYETATLMLAQVGDVPGDADAVVVAGPTRRLLDEEHASLERYLGRGGAVLALVDPGANTDLHRSLERWGVDLGDDIVVDYLQGLFGRATTPLAAEYPTHPINEGLREPVMFHVASSVGTRMEARERFSDIVRTSPESWGETNLATGKAQRDADDVPGPVTIGIAGDPLLPEGDGGGARLVVFGDADFASNQLIDNYRNRDVFVNSVNWLMGDVEAISIRPNTARASRFNPSQEQFTTIRHVSLFVLPELIAVLGVVAWWMRRRAPGR